MEYRTIYFKTSHEALSVLNQLKQLINRCGQVTIAQYYIVCNVKPDSLETDIYGWTCLNTASVNRIPDSYLGGYMYFINFPEVERVDAVTKIKKDIINRDDILDKAKSIINGERQGTYGSPEDSFQVIANFWSSYLNTDLTPHDVANMMILLKIARNAGGVYKDDNWIDICGYAAIGGELQDKYNKEN